MDRTWRLVNGKGARKESNMTARFWTWFMLKEEEDKGQKVGEHCRLMNVNKPQAFFSLRNLCFVPCPEGKQVRAESTRPIVILQAGLTLPKLL